MNQETKTCQNCKQEFTIEPDDFAFYEKMKVPPPTFCSECRMIRRMVFRNERVLYKRKCNAPSHTEEIVSTFSPEKPVTVYDDRYWWSDAWSPIDYGEPYDFSSPFFEQFKQLLRRVPLINLSITNMANCSYCNVSEGDKDSFFISASERNENISYANRVVFSKDSQDLYVVNAVELCYELVNCNKCYRTFFSRNCNDCSESAFLWNCSNCNYCFGCTNLRNKSYHFFNQPLSREEYKEKMQGIDLGSFASIERFGNELKELSGKSIHRFANILKCVDVTGDNLAHAKNTHYSFDMVGNPSAEDCKYIAWGGAGVKDTWDGGPGVGVSLEHSYEVTDTGIQSSSCLFTSVVYGSFDMRYSINCHGSQHLFGCYGLRNKEYCILNQQYTKEEYKILVPKIVAHMNDMPYTDAGGRIYRYGEFFPFEVSPYAYNEVIAQEYHPLTKEKAHEKRYTWKEQDVKSYQVTVSPENVPDHIKDVTDDILKETIGCAHDGKCTHQCTTAFKIMPQELAFYRKIGLPLPRLCSNCRHYQRLKQRNPLKLWHRQCMCDYKVYENTTKHQHHKENRCPNKFETTYSPERKEIVYCEQCYQVEVI